MESGMASETHGDVVIIAAGPAGLATGACLRERAVSFDIIEKDSTVASSWRARYEQDGHDVLYSMHIHTRHTRMDWFRRDSPLVYFAARGLG
jgi:cation diffusion facilitator CzcD-associated flavoprotein CzcO